MLLTGHLESFSEHLLQGPVYNQTAAMWAFAKYVIAIEPYYPVPYV